MEKDSWSEYAVEYDPLQSGSIDRTDTEPHDRAIQRALCAQYKIDPTLQNQPANTIFISRLNYETTEDILKQSFSKYGKIKSCKVVRDIITGYSKGYAFIEYELEYDASLARNQANKIIIDDKQVFVDYELERILPGWKPRRLGGGFGGRREAGQLRFGGRDRPFKKPYELQESEKKSIQENDKSRNRGNNRKTLTKYKSSR